MKRIEFTGVFYRGLGSANHFGIRLSHPATIGMRDVAVKSTLELAIMRAVTARTANGTRIATAQVVPSAPRLSHVSTVRRPAARPPHPYG